MNLSHGSQNTRQSLYKRKKLWGPVCSKWALSLLVFFYLPSGFSVVTSPPQDRVGASQGSGNFLRETHQETAKAMMDFHRKNPHLTTQQQASIFNRTLRNTLVRFPRDTLGFFFSGNFIKRQQVLHRSLSALVKPSFFHIRSGPPQSSRRPCSLFYFHCHQRFFGRAF